MSIIIVHAYCIKKSLQEHYKLRFFGFLNVVQTEQRCTSGQRANDAISRSS